MFKQNKWEQWYDSLPAHTKMWLKNQPVWHDMDMFKALAVGILVGLLFGVMI